MDANEVLKRLTAAELDVASIYIGVGHYWRNSDRRKELVEIENKEQENINE